MWSITKVVFVSILNTLQIFTANVEFSMIQDIIANSSLINPTLGHIYSLICSIIFVLAPALTASFVLLFFKEAVSLIRYHLYAKANIYYFSELSEKSLMLAQDIHEKNSKNHLKHLIVFAGVEMDEDDDQILVAKAEKINAICLKREINCLPLKSKKFIKQQKFYFIREDEDKNVAQALNLLKDKLTKNYGKETELYIFAQSAGSESLISSIDVGEIIVRRVNENRNLAWQTLRDIPIFNHPDKSLNSEKVLNIVVIGCGKYGRELVKTMTWLCQMPGYILNLHVFDKDQDVELKFKSIAPELIEKSGEAVEGEAYYNLTFYPNTDVDSYDFIDKICAIDCITSIFITLGSDETNIDTAIKVRTFLSRKPQYKTWNPIIYPVVYSELRNITNVSKLLKKEDNNPSVVNSFARNIDKYNLWFVGSITSCYSLENIEQTELEELALKYHLCWYDKDTDTEKIESATALFNKIEYYRTASMAQAFYIEYLKKLDNIRALIFDDKNRRLFNLYEHRRWNAYMRAEGFVYCEQRNDLAKQHNDLVAFDELSDYEKEKDQVWKIAIRDEL